jgi:hypothetical protein
VPKACPALTMVLEAFPTTLKLAAITMTMAMAPAGLGAHGSGKVRTNAKSVRRTSAFDDACGHAIE